MTNLRIIWVLMKMVYLVILQVDKADYWLTIDIDKDRFNKRYTRLSGWFPIS